MSIRNRFILTILGLSVSLPLTTATAQRGNLIEGLFRSIAEAQAEKERIKRQEAEKRAQALSEAERSSGTKDPYKATLPSNFGPQPKTSSPRSSASVPRTRTGSNMSINVRSREAAQYAGNLVALNEQIGAMLDDLRNTSKRNVDVRGLLPEAYAIAADARTLLQQCDGLSRLDTIVDPYRELDARWRQFSFNIQSVSGVSKGCRDAVQQCDKLCGLMSKQLNLEPQFDRRALRDVMMTASVYMQAMVDDFEIAVADRNECQQFTHDLRKLRQRLLSEAQRVDDTSYNEVVASFSEFAVPWREFSKRAYAIENAHLHRRLDRIGECGEQTYRLLRMTPPISAADLADAAHRLHEGLESMFGQLTMRSMVRLPPKEQIRVMQAFRDIYDQAIELEELLERNSDRSRARDTFVSIDRSWISLQASLANITVLNRGNLSEIERSCEQLRIAFGIEGGHRPTASIAELLQAAAALEGTAEYMDAALARYSRQLTPAGYRKSVLDAVHEFHHHSEGLYELLDSNGQLGDQRYLGKLQAEAEHLLEGWTQLASDLDHIGSHGLSSAQARSLKNAQREAVPFVAEITAALLQ